MTVSPVGYLVTRTPNSNIFLRFVPMLFIIGTKQSLKFNDKLTNFVPMLFIIGTKLLETESKTMVCFVPM